MAGYRPMNEETSKYLREIGSKGGKARSKSLSPARRSAIARKAAKAKWRKHKATKQEKLA
jgi:hypothetical protein